MNLATKERINIKGLVEEPAPQTDLIFDPGKEITRASWQKMLSQLSELMESDESGRYFPGMFMHMFYLASQVRSLPEIGKDSDTVNKIFDWLNKELDQQDYFDFAYKAIPLRLLFADEVEQIRKFPGFDKSEQQVQGLIADFVSQKPGTNWHAEIADMLVAIKIMYPTEFGWLFGGNEKLQQHTLECINNFNGDNFSKIRLAADCRLVFPSMISEMKLNSDLLTTGRDILSDFAAANYWRDFVRTAFNLKVLSAERIEFDEVGLKLTMTERIIPPEPIAVLPETRRF